MTFAKNIYQTHPPDCQRSIYHIHSSFFARNSTPLSVRFEQLSFLWAQHGNRGYRFVSSVPSLFFLASFCNDCFDLGRPKPSAARRRKDSGSPSSSQGPFVFFLKQFFRHLGPLGFPVLTIGFHRFLSEASFSSLSASSISESSL